MAYCGKCLHLDVCKTAETCDGHVPRCKHFMDKDTFTACFGIAPWTCQLGSKGCYPDGGCRYTRPCKNKVFTHADQLRAMSNEELAKTLYNMDGSEWCHNLPQCGILRDTDQELSEKKCIGCALKWLQQPAEEDTP